MNIEEEIKLLKIDFMNLRKELSESVDRIGSRMDYIQKNLEILFQKNEMNLRHKYQCQPCEGHGTIYISPISDMGQSNKCTKCHGEGVIWI